MPRLAFLQFGGGDIEPLISLAVSPASLESNIIYPSEGNESLSLLLTLDAVFAKNRADQPQFAIASEGLTEFGFSGDTGKWVDLFLEAVKRYRPGFKVYPVAGEGDTAFIPSPEFWRERWGGMNYSFERKGVYFIALDSTTPAYPLPGFTLEALAFLETRLDEIPIDAPIILMTHYNPGGERRASPFDFGRVWNMIAGRPNVLILCGSDGERTYERIANTDVVFTPQAEDKAAWNQIQVFDDAFRVERWDSASTSPIVLLDRKLAAVPSPHIKIITPEPGSSHTERIDLQTILDRELSSDASMLWEIDEDKSGALNHRDSAASAVISLNGLTPGAHWLRVSVEGAGTTPTSSYTSFYYDPPPEDDHTRLQWRFAMDGGARAAPLVVGDQVFVGSITGQFYSIDLASGRPRWSIDMGSEIYGAPAAADDLVLCVTANGKITALQSDGRMRWIFDSEHTIKATPAIAQDSREVYIATTGGSVLALDIETGQRVWQNDDPGYAVIASPVVVDNRLYVTAWDGFLYCMDRRSGSMLWKRPGPSNFRQPDRTMAPADCTPVWTGKEILITDRGFRAGRYTPQGRWNGYLNSGVSAISLSDKGDALYLRRVFGPVAKVTPSGRPLWDSWVVAGRVPAPSVESDGCVYVCTDNGRLVTLDSESGKLKWEYQVTPGLYVFAPPVIAGDLILVVGSDGVLTAIKK